MAQVISATTKFAQRAHATGRRHQDGLAKHYTFLAKSEDLLTRARAAAADDRFNDAVELAYQAGLRAAGAWIAVTAVGKRKRVPSSAWDQLALVGGQDASGRRNFVATLGCAPDWLRGWRMRRTQTSRCACWRLQRNLFLWCAVKGRQSKPPPRPAASLIPQSVARGTIALR